MHAAAFSDDSYSFDVTVEPPWLKWSSLVELQVFPILISGSQQLAADVLGIRPYYY